MRCVVVTACTLALAAAGCGSESESPQGTAPGGTGAAMSAPSTATAPVATEQPSGEPTDTSTEGQSPTHEPPGEALPGERVDLPPADGAMLAVVGVAVQADLAVHELPDPTSAVVLRAEPLQEDLVATGHNRQVDDESMWVEVAVGGSQGWVPASSVGHLGQVEDVTYLIDPLPSAPSMGRLAEDVGRLFTSEEPAPSITVVDGPHSGDLETITVDVLGVGDDAIRGHRLVVFAEAGGEGFTVRTVESTLVCLRGVHEGLCV